MRKLTDLTISKPAVAPNTGPVGAITGLKINGTGFGRVKFTFTFGNPTTSANLSTNCGVWKASTSGATFVSVANAVLAAITSGLGSQVTAEIDTVIDSANPWLLISGMSMVSSDWANACIAELYNGTRSLPGTVSAVQQVSVN